MINSPYYHGLIKKYITLFGTLFNEIKIERFDSNGNVLQSFKVPIQYGPREKFLARVEELPNFEEKSMQLAVMGFEITSFDYDQTRKLSTSNRINIPVNVANNVSVNSFYTPTPWNISFKLSILTKTMEDGCKVVEQILPHFTPERTLKAKLLDDIPDYVTNIPIILDSVSLEDNYESAFEQRRIIIWNLNFTLKGYMYSSVVTPKIIKVSKMFVYDSFSNNSLRFAETSVAGMTANGLPTSNIMQVESYNNNYVNPLTFLDEETGYPYFVMFEEENNG